MSHTESAWTRLASRTARGLLVRKGITHDALIKRLASLGVVESARAIEGKLLRGSFRFGFFLQILCAVDSDHPAHWKQIIQGCVDWDEASSKIMQAELRANVASVEEVCATLISSGVALDPAATVVAVDKGTFSLVLFLQFCLVLQVAELASLVDLSDIRRTADQEMLA